MALCLPCREDNHSRHSGRVSLSWKRKGLHSKQMSRETTCDCAQCEGGWRGVPQDVPRMPRSLR